MKDTTVSYDIFRFFFAPCSVFQVNGGNHRVTPGEPTRSPERRNTKIKILSLSYRFDIPFLLVPSFRWTGGITGSPPANQLVHLKDGTQNTFTVLQIRTFPSPLSLLQKKHQNKLKLSVRNLFHEQLSVEIGLDGWYHCQFCYFSIVFFAPCSVFQVNGSASPG